MVVLSFVIASCGIQNKLITPVAINEDEQPFYWRVEIKVKPYNNDVYNVLAVLGNMPQLVSLSPLDRESLFEAGAVAIFVNKVAEVLLY